MNAISALFTLSALLTSLSATAAGDLHFGGRSAPVTCTLANENTTVQLPSINTSELNTAGTVAGATPFQIALTCDDTGGYVIYTAFDITSDVDSATGNLIIATGTQAATNVQVQILNEDRTAVNLADGGQTTQDADLGYSISWTYYAQYYATGQATSGSVSAYVTFTIEMM
ncbi:fimbrial protein [Serratia quinivorans]|uniref:fimbrial protein n=1 Tax=Serratia quinivorans TaxID=137545 RepID=UPI001C43B190|nr:fimbrial protein [Serratia quinivorans]MBV6694008.1 type 1 fimbrial protein [Serratia quinivorans]